MALAAANEVKNDCNSLTAKVASDELRQSRLVFNQEVEEPAQVLCALSTTVDGRLASVVLQLARPRA